MAEVTQEDGFPGDEGELEELSIALVRQVPLAIVFARIVIVTAMSFAAAFGIFVLVGGFWVVALACFGITVLFMFLMFFVERFAEPRKDATA